MISEDCSTIKRNFRDIVQYLQREIHGNNRYIQIYASAFRKPWRYYEGGLKG